MNTNTTKIKRADKNIKSSYYDPIYYQLHKEEFRQKNQSNYRKNRLKRLEYQNQYRKVNIEACRKRDRDYIHKSYLRHRQQKTERNKLLYVKLRKSVLEKLGGEKCVMCGFTDYRALQIDHINGGGTKEIKSFTSNSIYMHHILAFPAGYQVLCANCNRIKVYLNEELRRYGRKE